MFVVVESGIFFDLEKTQLAEVLFAAAFFVDKGNDSFCLIPYGWSSGFPKQLEVKKQERN